jgi:hypothetical protein
MTTGTATAKRTVKKAAKPAPPPVEVEDDLEELEEDEVEDTSTKKSSAHQVTFGASDLAALVSVGRDKPVTPREIRTLIRKMARDGSKRVQREIIAGNRSRYDWSGPDDPEVKAIIAAFNGGELEADKKEKLDALKARKAAKVAETGPKPAKTKKVAKVVEEVEEDDEELELEDDDEES